MHPTSFLTPNPPRQPTPPAKSRLPSSPSRPAKHLGLTRARSGGSCWASSEWLFLTRQPLSPNSLLSWTDSYAGEEGTMEVLPTFTWIIAEADPGQPSSNLSLLTCSVHLSEIAYIHFFLDNLTVNKAKEISDMPDSLSMIFIAGRTWGLAIWKVSVLLPLFVWKSFIASVFYFTYFGRKVLLPLWWGD